MAHFHYHAIPMSMHTSLYKFWFLKNLIIIKWSHTTTLYTHINLFIVPLLMRRSDVSVDVSLVKDIEIMITFSVSNFDKYLIHRQPA